MWGLGPSEWCTNARAYLTDLAEVKLQETTSDPEGALRSGAARSRNGRCDRMLCL